MGITIVALLVIFLALGVPIAFVLGLVATGSIALAGDVRYLAIVPNRIFAGLDSFVILAVPFFILAGILMNEGGASTRLVRFAMAILGHVRGGLAVVSVATSMFFAGVSGAATADAAAIATVMVPAMERAKFGKAYSTALIGAASLMGPIIPPSIILVVYGSVAEVSIGKLFLAGVVPGVMMGLALVAMAVWHSWRFNIPRERRATIGEVGRSAIEAIPALLLPIVILGGIISGAVTPTEAAALAAVLGLIIGLFIYKELRVSALPRLFGQAALISGAVLLIVAMANAFSWILTAAQIPQQVTQLLVSVTNEPWQLLLLINALLLVVGCFIEGVAALLILVPILLPVAVSAGVDPVHFGMIMSINLVIGFITPPVGICLFVLCSVTGITMEQLIPKIWPFLGMMILILMAVTFFPSLTMAVPNWFDGL